MNGLVVPPKVQHLAEQVDPVAVKGAERIFAAHLDRDLVLIVLDEFGIVLATAQRTLNWLFGTADYASSDRDQTGTFTGPDGTYTVAWESRKDGKTFRELFTYHAARTVRPRERTPAQTAPTEQMVPTNSVTTLQELPGTTIERSLGVITALTSNAGWTATHKGNTALDLALRELRMAASGRGANAIVGLTVSAFGAGGGITNVVGGDAVGVLLMGTAVLVAEPGATPPPTQGN